MSSEDVNQELVELGYDVEINEIDYAYASVTELITDYGSFKINEDDKLYSIQIANAATAKGLKPGNSLDTIKLLYGNEDEHEMCATDYTDEEYIYHMDGYMFAIGVSKKEGEKVVCWRVFVNNWNNPNFFSAGPDELTDYAGDESLGINESNFQSMFSFGMKRSSVIKKLSKLGVRIAGVGDDGLDDGNCSIFTDHINFQFSKDTAKLNGIHFFGLETAKGLKIGDSIETLYQLYGEPEVPDEMYNTYEMNGYWFKVILRDGEVASWSVDIYEY